MDERAAATTFFSFRGTAPPEWAIPGGEELRVGDLAGRAWGRTSAPIVLLAHGWEGRSDQLGGFIEPLVARGFRVVAFDQPGHGASGRRESLAVVDMRDATGTFGAALGRPLHAIIGHSMGATAAALAVADGRLHASRLALIAPAREPELYARRAASYFALPPERTEAFVALVRERLGPFEDLDVARRARARQEPLLLLHDPEDREVPYEGSVAIAAAWSGAELVPVAGQGHRRILKHTGTIQRIVDFVATGEAGSK